jgi:hypothetical protein
MQRRCFHFKNAGARVSVALLAMLATGPAISGQRIALAGYTTSGLLDPYFGAGGKVVATFAGVAGFTVAGVAIDSQQRIVVAGTAVESGSLLPTFKFAIATVYVSRVLIGSMLGVLSVAAAPQTNVTQAQESSAASATSVSAWLQYISAQVRILQAEMVECRLEIMEAKLPALETELHETQSEQQRLEEEQRLQAAQAAQIDTQLTQQDLTRDERQELEARRAAFLATAPRTSQSAQSSLAQREAEARQRIAQHQQRMKALLERAKELMPGGSNTSNSVVTSESRQR